MLVAYLAKIVCIWECIYESLKGFYNQQKFVNRKYFFKENYSTKTVLHLPVVEKIKYKVLDNVFMTAFVN